MIDRKTNDLMNKEIDGSNSPGETDELKVRLESDSRARQVYDDLRDLSHVLSTLEAVDPPAAMKSRIMNAVLRQRSAQPKKTTIFEYLSHRVQPRAALRLGYAFSIGLALGVLTYALYFNRNNDSLDTSDASGTIAIGEPGDKLQSGESFNVALPQVRATVAVKYLRAIPLMNVHLSSGQNITTDITFDTKSIHVRAVRQFNDPRSSVTIRDGAISIASNGSNEYTIFFAHETSSSTPVHMSISASGALLYSKTVSFASSQPMR